MIEAVPAGSVDNVSVAVLLRPLPGVSVAEPSEAVPFINVTDPVGAAYVLETVAVSVTDCPKLDGFSEDATAVVVVAAFTTWLIAGEVAALKFPVAAYTAVIASVPTGRIEVLNVAVLLRPPPGIRLMLASAVAPFIKTTGPVGAE